MYFEYLGSSLYYEDSGVGIAVLFLHGWGGDCSSFRGASNYFEMRHRVITVDLFGHGNSDYPPDGFKLFDAADAIAALLRHLSVSGAAVIGHSFGGRIAMYLAARHPGLVSKLILVDSAGLRPRFNLKKYIRVKKYKLYKRLGFNTKNMGSDDYKKLEPAMRNFFIHTVNDDVSGILSSIVCETLLIWGERDTDTPLYMAKMLHKKIRGSGLIIFKNAGHFSYVDRHLDFVNILNSFISEGE